MKLRQRLRRGASAVEFALTLPLLIVMISAIVDLTWFLQQETSLLQGVREGVRVGASTVAENDPLGTARLHTEDALKSLGIDCAAVDCDITASVDTSGALDLITLAAVVPYEAPFGLLPSPEDLRASLTMALEDQEAF
jgi:Flp pilus assembly protein TadG